MGEENVIFKGIPSGIDSDDQIAVTEEMST